MLTAQSARDFALAQHRAFTEKIISFFTRRSGNLLSFAEVKSRLNLQISVDRGLQEIELDDIVGSAGKHREFTRRFLPKTLQNEDRWRRIDELFYRQGFPPIEVYKVGQVYFVRDGNHRVSVNRTHKVPTIEAYVVEYITPVPVEKSDTLAHIVRKIEQTGRPAALAEPVCAPCGGN